MFLLSSSRSALKYGRSIASTASGKADSITATKRFTLDKSHARGFAAQPGERDSPSVSKPGPSTPRPSTQFTPPRSNSAESASTSPSLSRLSPAPRSPPADTIRTPVWRPLNFNPDHSFETVIPKLPERFGSNQRLSVPDETRALLEEIVGTFNAPIRYAFAYGSGVFKQKGYEKNTDEPPMLDFIFAVSHADHWHSINMDQNKRHYPLTARLVGSDLVSRFQNISPGLWFNAYVPMKGTVIKYGVTTIDNLSNDLLTWRTLYTAGRMHKPIRIIKDDPRIRLTQQVNLVSALRTALMLLPSDFSERQLFETITAFSYAGDPRMRLPGENRNKVSNIVSLQRNQFHDLYWRLASGIPGVHWPSGRRVIEQDIEPRARLSHLRRLPITLLQGVEQHYLAKSPELANMKAGDEAAFWLKVAGDEELGNVIQDTLRTIVRGPATVQSLKGIFSAGIVKSARYSAAKIGKWWKGRS